MALEQERHQMTLELMHPSGAEQWYCPTCGRRFLLLWPPDYKKIIMQAGNEYAIHAIEKNSIQIGTVQVNEKSELSLDLENRINQILNDLEF